MSSALNRMMTLTAGTKRPPTMSAGKRGAPAEHLVGVPITPLDPLDSGTAADVFQRRPELKTAMRLLQCFTTAADVQEGDLLVVSGKEYPIRLVNTWRWSEQETYAMLVLEETAP